MGLEFATENTKEAALIQMLYQFHVTQMPNNIQLSLYIFNQELGIFTARL